MMRNIKIMSVLYNVIVALFIGMSLQAVLPVSGGLVSAGIFLCGLLLKNTKGLALMGLQVEYWQNHIEGRISKDNSFMEKSHKASDDVLAGKVVHIPQAGGDLGVVKNPTSFPLTAIERADSDVVYVLNQYAFKPIRIADIDNKELSYNKRDSVLGDGMNEISDAVAEDMIYAWLRTPAYGTYAASVIPTARIEVTAGVGGLNNSDAIGGIGNRKKATLSDLQKMQTKFRQEGRWFEGKMYCLLPPNMLSEIAPADSVLTATYMSNLTESERREGVYMKIQGWKIMSRSSVVSLTAAKGLRLPGEASVATDCGAGLFWYEKSVEYAKGEFNEFNSDRNPFYLGDIYNFAIRMGGRARRADFKGIALLMQAPV